MNRQLQAFLVEQLAGHQRRNRFNSELAAVAEGSAPWVTEHCSCGTFEVQKPTYRKPTTSTAQALARSHATAMAIEVQWRDHLVETIALGVASWLEQDARQQNGMNEDGMWHAVEMIRRTS